MRALCRERPGAGGFTLIELLLVLAIFSLTIALAAPHVSSGIGSVSVKSAARKAAAALNNARVLAARDRQNYYARFTGDGVVIEPSGGEGSKKIALPEGVQAAATGRPLVVFYPGGGSSGGAFEVSGQGGRVYSIKVDPSTGMVKTSAMEKR